MTGKERSWVQIAFNACAHFVVFAEILRFVMVTIILSSTEKAPYSLIAGAYYAGLTFGYVAYIFAAAWIALLVANGVAIVFGRAFSKMKKVKK